jgi:Na+/serine symporter
MRSACRRSTLRRALLIGLLSGCFATLVSVAPSAALGLLGPFPLASIGAMLPLLPVIFVVSCVLVIISILFWETPLDL